MPKHSHFWSYGVVASDGWTADGLHPYSRCECGARSGVMPDQRAALVRWAGGALVRFMMGA